jgi:hypothetical protein
MGMGAAEQRPYGNDEGIQNLGRKLERRRASVKPSSRWKDNIEMDLREIRVGLSTRFSWLTIGSIGGLLLTW